MNKRNIIGNTALIIGLLAAGASFAADNNASTPAAAKNREQNAGKQQTMAQHRNEHKLQEGNDDKRREMYREQMKSAEMRNAAGSRPR